MDTQNQPATVASPQQCVVRGVTEPWHAQARPGGVEEPSYTFGEGRRQSEPSVRIVAASSGFGISAGSA